MARVDRQQRRRLDPGSRRAALLDAAADAFARQPYPEVTISAIAARAGASDALLYRYFSGKEQLYGEVVRIAVQELLDRQAAALAALPSGVPVRDRVREATMVYLDHIAASPSAWALPLDRPGIEPETAVRIRAETRGDYVERLRELLAPGGGLRREYALWGYFGFLDAACLRWAARGFPEDERWPLLDAALGALEGSLGDWAA